MFTIRDVIWLTALVALCLGWSADRRYYVGEYRGLTESHIKLQRDTAKKMAELDQKIRLIEEDYVAKHEAAIDRELELKTTVRALKLRLGEDPYGK